MRGPDYGRLLKGPTMNLLVRDVEAALPFYTEVLGLRLLYSDPDFAALEGDDGIRFTLHAELDSDQWLTSCGPPLAATWGGPAPLMLMAGDRAKGVIESEVDPRAVAGGQELLDHFLANPQNPKDLHDPHVDRRRSRQDRGARMALGHQRADSVPCEQDRGGQASRTATGDQDWYAPGNTPGEKGDEGGKGGDRTNGRSARHLIR